MAIIDVNSANFVEEVLQVQNPVLLDFYAEWCVPCKLIASVLAEVSKEHQNIKICRIDVEKEMELSEMFGIMSIPTIVYVKDGTAKDEIVGMCEKEAIERMIR